MPNGSGSSGLSLARQSEALAEIRYRAGATDLQSWLEEQELRRSAESTLAQTRRDQLANLMGLYQALGVKRRHPAPDKSHKISAPGHCLPPWLGV